MTASAGFRPATGSLVADDGTTFGPDLTRSAFLASARGRAAERLILNEPHASWRVNASIAGRAFAIGLYFEGERLEMLVAALTDPAFGSSWSEWSRAREEARKAAHEAWLAGIDPTIGAGRDYPWGFVSSVYDDRSGGSEIIIRYGAMLPERLSASRFATTFRPTAEPARPVGRIRQVPSAGAI